MYKENDLAKRNDTGAVVRIIEVRPVGLSVFYTTEDHEDGHVAIFGEKDLRPHVFRIPKERKDL